jgi:flap endonuclease-1
MDGLTFGSNILLRHMTFSEARKMPIKEFHLSKVLEGLEMTQDEVCLIPLIRVNVDGSTVY